jgi:hypothetical protein
VIQPEIICRVGEPACPEINKPCNPDASQAFLLCYHDVHYMAQLTPNTDNKVKKLVMFFARDTLPLRQETARGKTQRPRSPLRFDTGALPASALNKITIRGQYSAFNNPCTAKHIKLKKHCTRMAKNLPYPPSPASEATSCYEGMLPSGRDASGIAFLLYCRAVMFKPMAGTRLLILDNKGLNITH